MRSYFRTIYITMFFVLALCLACRNSSPHIAKEKACSTVDALIEALETIDEEEGLLEKRQMIESLFQKLVDNIIEVRKCELATHTKLEINQEDRKRSMRLKCALNRICRIEGGKEWIEKAEAIAVEKLNIFESKGNVRLDRKTI